MGAHLLRREDGSRFRGQCAPQPRGDFPNISAEFAPHGRIGRVTAPLRTNAAQTVMEPILGPPTDLTEGWRPVGHSGQAAFDGPLQARAEPRTVGRLDQDFAHQALASRGPLWQATCCELWRAKTVTDVSA